MRLLLLIFLTFIWPISLLAETASVLDYGAKGDGVQDDFPAFQAAVDFVNSRGGGIVQVPAVNIAAGNFYKLSRTVIVPSNIAIIGEGNASFIKNVKTTDKPVESGSCFMFGNLYREDMRRLADPAKPRFVAIAGTSLSTKILSGIPPVFLATAKIGDVVAVSSSEWVPTSDSRPYPAKMFLDVITAIDPVARTITGRRNSPLKINDPVLANLSRNTYPKDPIGGLGNLQAVRDSGLRKLQLYSLAGTAVEINGIVDGRFEDLTIIRSQAIFRFNATYFSGFSNINATFSGWGIEFGLNSGNVVMQKIEGRFFSRADVPVVDADIIKVGENSFANELKSITIRAAEFTGKKVLEISGNNNNLTAVAVDGRKAVDYGISFADGDSNQIQKCQIISRGSAGVYFGERIGTLNSVRSCKFYGAPKDAAVLVKGGLRNSVSMNRFDRGEIGVKISGNTNRIADNFLNQICGQDTSTDPYVKNNCNPDAKLPDQPDPIDPFRQGFRIAR